MMSAVRRVAGAGAVAATAVFALVLTVNGQSKIACDPDNGGIKLPEGFCALVVANDLGPARHVAVAPNGDVYVAFMSTGGRGRPETGGGVIGLRDTNGDGKFDVREPIGTGSTTGVALRNGYLYLAHPKTIERFKMTAGQLKPAGAAEDRRQGPAARLAAAQRQGPHVRRQGQPVHQRRRAEQRLSAARSSARREGSGSLPDSRETRRRLEVRREQAESDAGPGHEVRDRPAAVPRHHLARERALHRDEQPRSAQFFLAGQVHGAGQRRPSGRADVSRDRAARTSAGRSASTTTSRRSRS